MTNEQMEKFAASFTEKIEALTKVVGERQELTNFIQREIGSESSSLRAEMKKDFDAGVAAHRQYISELYARFERIVYVVILLFSAVVVFLGYSEWRRVPDALKQQIKETVTAHKDELDKDEKDEADALKKLADKASTATTDVDTTTKAFHDKVGQQDLDYGKQLGQFKDDTIAKFRSDLRDVQRSSYLGLDFKTPAVLSFLLDDWDNLRNDDEQFRALKDLPRLSRVRDSDLYKKVNVVLSKMKPYSEINNLDLRRLKITIGLLFDNDPVEKEIRSTLTANETPENKAKLKDLLNTLDTIRAPASSLNVPRAQSLAMFSNELVDLLGRYDPSIKAEAFSLLVASGELKVSQISAVADFIRQAGQSTEYFNAVVDSSSALPVSPAILRSLEDTVAALRSSDNRNIKKAAATLVSDYVTRNATKLEIQRAEINQIRGAIMALNLGDEAPPDVLNDLAEAMTYTWSILINGDQLQSRRGKSILTQKNIPFKDSNGVESGYLLADLQATQQLDLVTTEITIMDSKKIVAKFAITVDTSGDSILFKGDQNPQLPNVRVAVRKDDRGAMLLLKEEKVSQ